MYKFFFGSSNETLSLSYNRDPVKKNTYTASSKKVCCEALDHTEINDYHKLCQFLFLQQQEFYPTFLKFNSVINECLTFLKKYGSDGYKHFLSVVECEIFTNERYGACGNHYIVAVVDNISKVDYVLEKLKNRQPLYLTKAYSCIVLKNYTEVFKTTLAVLSTDINCDRLNQPIMLGKLVKKFSDNNKIFDKQIPNIRTAELAKDLLRSIRRRLNLPQEYDSVLDSHPRKAVDESFAMLLYCLAALQTPRDPLEVRNVMQNVNDQLIILVSNFCNYLQAVLDGNAEVRNHAKIYATLHQIHSLIIHLSYETVDDVFCVVYRSNSNSNTTPVIYVTETNFSPLLSMFKEKKYTTLKFRIVKQLSQNDDWNIEIGNGNSVQKVSLCQFSVTNSQEDHGNTMFYITPCANKHEGNYHWICMNCEELVKVTSQAKLVCGCGIGPRPSTNNECIKCAINDGRLKLPSVKREVTLCVEDTLVCNKTEDEFNAAASCVIITKPSIKSEPVHFSVCSVTVTQLLTKNHEQVQAETVRNLSHYYKIYLFVPKPRTYTVLVIGSSGAGKSTLLNSIYCMQQHKTLEDAAKREIQCLLPVTLEETGEAFDGIHENNVNEHYAGVGQSVTQHPKDYVLDYGTFKICFVDTPGITDTRGFEQDADNIKYIQEHLLELKEVHAVMFVIKNSEVKLSAEFENTMLALFGILPRTAIRNCFFVYTFAAPDFQPGAARTPLTALLAKFSKQHNVELSLDTSNEYCVDNGILRQLLHCQKSDDKFAVTAYADYWKANENSILRMFDDVRKVKPVLREDFTLAAKMKELGDILRPYGKGVLTPEAKRLMASIANGSLHGIAIYCRNKSEGVESIRDDEWHSVEAFWRPQDEAISNKAVEINALIRELHMAQRNTVTDAQRQDMDGRKDEEGVRPSEYQNHRQVNRYDDDDTSYFSSQTYPEVRRLSSPTPIAVTTYEARVDTSDHTTPPRQDVNVHETAYATSDSTMSYTDHGTIQDHEGFARHDFIDHDFEQISGNTDNADTLQYEKGVSNTPDVLPTPPELGVQSPALPQNATPLITILVIGRSEKYNLAFIDSVFRGRQKEVDESGEGGLIGRPTENGCMITCDSYEVHFISIVPHDELIDWNAYPEVHGFIFLIADNSFYVQQTTEKDLRELMGVVPRSGVRNCCIINIITPTMALSKYRASSNLDKIASNFRGLHALDVDVKHFCVDENAIIIPAYVTRCYTEALKETTANVREFVLSVAKSPVTFNELKLTECLTRLGDIIVRNPTYSLEGKRLMSSVAEKTMSETAKRLRGYGLRMDKPLSDDEWQAAEFWPIDENLIQIIQEINKYISEGQPVKEAQPTSTRF